jgi:hypothetical protein
MGVMALVREGEAITPLFLVVVLGMLDAIHFDFAFYLHVLEHLGSAY